MAGLFAWAADVVKPNNNEEDNNNSILVFNFEDQRYVQELETKANSLRRVIQDLRLRIPPPDISQRLPHLHAQGLASNADLALQLSSHLSTKEQVHWRKITLQEENAVYERAISNCEKKIQDKLEEANLMQHKLKDIEIAEKQLRVEMGVLQMKIIQSSELHERKTSIEDQKLTASNSMMIEKLEMKKKELNIAEEKVQELEKRWAHVQQNFLIQPSSVKKEKILDKQLHGLLQQLTAKQAQAENLVVEIHVKERELEALNGLRRRLDSGSLDVNNRSRLGTSSLWRSSFPDYIVDAQSKLSYDGGRSSNQQRLMLFKSAFVLYILVLHVLVFIKLSF